MFRTLIYPSSGACDCAVELAHRSFVLGSLCVGDLVQLGLSSVRVADFQPATRTLQSLKSQAPDDGYINVRNMLST